MDNSIFDKPKKFLANLKQTEEFRKFATDCESILAAIEEESKKLYNAMENGEGAPSGVKNRPEAPAGVYIAPPLKVKLAYPDAKVPSYAYDGDAGFDLSVYLPEAERKEGKTIFPGERALLDTGVHFGLPQGFWGSIQHRSSTEKKHRLRVVQGTIDQGYTGRIYVQVSNDNSFPITIHHENRLAQMILHRIVRPETFAVVEDLDSTARGGSGFGSTGK